MTLLLLMVMMMMMMMTLLLLMVMTQRLHPVEKRRDVLTAGCCPNGGADLHNSFYTLRFTL